MPLKKKLKTKEEEDQDEELIEESEDRSTDEDDQDFDDDDDDNEDDSEDDDDDDEDEDEEDEEDDEILVDFEARSLRSTDLGPIKLMIQQKLGPFSSLNIQELAKIVVNQESIGNAIYQVISEEDEDEEPQKPKSSKESKESNKEDDEDDTIFGILSIIDLNSANNKAFTSSFKTFLLKNYESDLKHRSSANRLKLDKLAELLDSNQVAYVINERYVNIPPAISVPMFESLMIDLDKLSAEHEIKKARYWLFLSKYFIQDATEAKSSKASTATNIYSNPEEEVFEEFSEHKFEISYAGKLSNATNGKWSDSDAILQPNLKGFLVPSSKIREAIEKVKELLK